MNVRTAAWLVAPLFVAGMAFGAAQNVPPTPPPPVPAQPTATGGVTLPPPATSAPSLAPITPPPATTPPPRGRRGAPTSGPAPSGSPSGTPAPPQFTTLDGVWEVELQTRAKTFYSHLTLKQAGGGGADVTGVWQRNNQKMPLTGTFDGRLFKFTATDGTTTYTFTGYAENFSDMVGLLSDGKNNTAFTAQHRKKEKTL